MSTIAEPATRPASSAVVPVELSRREYVRALRRLTLWLVGLGLAARVFRYLLDASIWNDEAAVGLNLIRRDYLGLTRTLDELQVAPILFLWVERAVMLALGTSEHAMRLVPFLFGVASLFVFWDFARRVAPPTAAALAVGVMAVARWPVTMSGTLKPYTGDLFWSVLLMALAARWRQRPERLWPLVALAAAVPCALAMSYPTVFVAGAVTLYLLPAVWAHARAQATEPARVTRRQSRWAAALFAAYVALMFATFAAIFALVQSQKSDPQAAYLKAFMHDYWAHGFPPADPLGFAWWFLKIHTGRLMSYPWGDGNGGSTGLFLLFSVGAWALWRSGNRPLFVLCLTPFALNFLAAVVRQYPYGACTRLSMHLSPAICLLIGMGWARLLEPITDLRRRLKFVTGGFAFLATFGVVQMSVDAYKPHRDQAPRWCQRVARELQRHVEPGDEIAYRCHAKLHHESFDWYMARFGEKVSWQGPPVTRGDTRRVWLVVVTAHEMGEKEEAELVAAAGPGWVTVARAGYLVQPDLRHRHFWHCTLRCLARDTEPPGPPLLQAFP